MQSEEQGSRLTTRRASGILERFAVLLANRPATAPSVAHASNTSQVQIGVDRTGGLVLTKGSYGASSYAHATLCRTSGTRTRARFGFAPTRLERSGARSGR